MGADKAFLQIDREPLWRRQLRLLEELRPNELFISGPPHPEWRNYKIIADARENSGPLGGVVSALRNCSTSLLFVLAIDLPNMTSSYLAKLIHACSENVGIVPRGQPLAAVYPARALPLAERLLAEEQLAMQNFTRGCVAQQLVRQIELAPADETLFFNLNTLANLAAHES